MRRERSSIPEQQLTSGLSELKLETSLKYLPVIFLASAELACNCGVLRKHVLTVFG